MLTLQSPYFAYKNMLQLYNSDIYHLLPIDMHDVYKQACCWDTCCRSEGRLFEIACMTHLRYTQLKEIFCIYILLSEKDKTFSMDSTLFYHIHLKEKNINICSFHNLKQILGGDCSTMNSLYFVCYFCT